MVLMVFFTRMGLAQRRQGAKFRAGFLFQFAFEVKSRSYSFIMIAACRPSRSTATKGIKWGGICMHIYAFKTLLILLTSVCSLAVSANENNLKPQLIEGTWTYRGAKTIVGSGTDETVVIKKEDDHWTIMFESTHYPRINKREAKPSIEREGPYPVTFEDQELVVTKVVGEAPIHYTFLCDERRLILPAFVQKKPGEWVFRGGIPSERNFRVQCEQDPFKVPVGKGWIPGVPGGRGFYSLEEAPRSTFWPSAQYLRFLERDEKTGVLRERFRLIFDDYGWPRYEKLESTGERSSDSFKQRIYIATAKAQPPAKAKDEE